MSSPTKPEVVVVTGAAQASVGPSCRRSPSEGRTWG